jgi:hypothetical protein
MFVRLSGGAGQTTFGIPIDVASFYRNQPI